MPSFIEHDDRPAVLAELHLRPFQSFATPHRFFHYAFVLKSGEAEKERQAFSALCAQLGATVPTSNTRFHLVTAMGWTLRWELHSEFASYTWSAETTVDAPFQRSAVDLPAPFKDHKPAGQMLVSVEAALVPRLESDETLETLFDKTNLSVIAAAEGCARVASDFQPHDTGAVRFLVEDLNLTPTRAGRLMQRMLELETYRCLALLGLPVARRAEPAVHRMESEVYALTREMESATSAAANQRLLRHLTSLSAELEKQIASTAFRLGATRAYAQILQARLEVLRESENGGYVSFSRFLRRRFNPAIATCNIIDDRQRALAVRLGYATDLLRARIQSELEDQNRLLLASMNRRSRMQLRLQQTVEGLSIAAVSYYITGLIGYLAKGAKAAGMLPKMIAPELAMAASVPLTILTVWWMLHQARKTWSRSGDSED
ncbi:MAG: DUF3422 domain-containing protein [Alphaproteobacteria bacterium]